MLGWKSDIYQKKLQQESCKNKQKRREKERKRGGEEMLWLLLLLLLVEMEFFLKKKLERRGKYEYQVEEERKGKEEVCETRRIYSTLTKATRPSQGISPSWSRRK